MANINYIIQNVGQIDIFSTVSKDISSGIDQNSAPIAGRNIEKYSHILPLLPEREETCLGRRNKIINFP